MWEDKAIRDYVKKLLGRIVFLHFLQKKGWPFYCDIELEYSSPKGSNAVKEVARCNAFCRKAAGC